MAEPTNSVVAIDVGGTLTRVGRVDAGGGIRAVRRQYTEPLKGPGEFARRLVGTVAGLLEGDQKTRVRALGMGIASTVAPDTGIMHSPPNLPGWDGASLKEPLERALGLPVYVGNDATLAALGEQRFGAGRGSSLLVYLTISTGIGGGLVMDGHPVMGAHGFAGEFGHVLVDPGGPVCNCGRRGCLESLASGSAIGRRARERLAAGGGGALRELAEGTPEGVNAATVATAARQGDPLANEVLEEAARSLGMGIASLLHAFDPELVVLGGGVSQSYDLFAETLHRCVEERVMPSFRGGYVIRPVELGDEAGLLGAAAMALDRLDALPAGGEAGTRTRTPAGT